MSSESQEFDPQRFEPVILPDQFIEPTLDSILPGESTYVTPWSMWVDLDGKCWIPSNITPSDTPRGTVSMWIARLEAGWAVDLTTGSDRMWQRSSGPVGVGASREDLLPVVALIQNPSDRRKIEDELKRMGSIADLQTEPFDVTVAKEVLEDIADPEGGEIRQKNRMDEAIDGGSDDDAPDIKAARGVLRRLRGDN